MPRKVGELGRSEGAPESEETRRDNGEEPETILGLGTHRTPRSVPWEWIRKRPRTRVLGGWLPLNDLPYSPCLGEPDSALG